MIVAGLGCRAGCAADHIVALVRAAAARAGCTVDALAAPQFKFGEPGLHEAARLLGLGLTFVEVQALAAVQHRCPTQSPAAERRFGIGAVAEGAALAASRGVLLLPRIANGHATCALAQAEAQFQT